MRTRKLVKNGMISKKMTQRRTVALTLNDSA